MAGPDRRDLCVVGDEDQTIYTFTGATSAFLTGFADRWPGAQVVDAGPQLPVDAPGAGPREPADRRGGPREAPVPTRPDGPLPTISRHADAAQELAALTTWIRARIGEGVAPPEIAVLVRINAQLAPIEEALTRAGIAYQVRGLRFYDRPEVRGALMALRRPPLEARGRDLAKAVRARWAEAVGWEADAAPEGDEARERQASLDTLLAIVDGIVEADPAADAATVIGDLEGRALHEREGSADGVNLLTYHRAKGLEWDAVFLPSLEEGMLPIRQAKDDGDALAEERRLLYVGITRAREHLALSWAQRREVRGRDGRREASRFLLDLRPRPGSRIRELPGPPMPGPAPKPRPAGGDPTDPVFAALREWRTGVARDEQMPPYVIAHDATLAAIADARPRSLAALRRVKGMGPTKLDKYGDAILAVLERADGEAG